MTVLCRASSRCTSTALSENYVGSIGAVSEELQVLELEVFRFLGEHVSDVRRYLQVRASHKQTYKYPNCNNHGDPAYNSMYKLPFKALARGCSVVAEA